MVERYGDFHLQLLAGEWREGSGEKTLPVLNPYSGETLTSIRTATAGDLDRGLRFARQIRTGMTHVNYMPVNDEPHMPFGGEKNSGLGRFNGEWAIEEFSTVQWVSVQRAPRQYPF